MNDFQLKPLRKLPPDALIPFLAKWQSNNSSTDLGVVRFAFEALPHAFDIKYGMARWHAKAQYFVYSYKPEYTKEDMCYVIATYRDGSKTTLFAYNDPLYDILVGQYGVYHKDFLVPEYDYIVIRCKTGREAEKRLMNISVTLNKPNIIKLFGDLKPTYQEVKSKEGKDTARLLILSNGYIIECGGIGQPIRGANIFNRRPKKIIYDDAEHLENTKTKERRDQNEADVIEESFGALHQDGELIYIGNKVHEDDCLGKFLKNKSWQHQFHQATYKDVKGIERSDWDKKYPMSAIEKRKIWYYSHAKLGRRAYYKNFYNIIVPDVEYKVRVHNVEYKREFGMNWLVFDTPTGKITKNCRIVIGCDPAISEKKSADNAAIIVNAFCATKTEDEPKRRYVLEYSTGKYDITDIYDNEELRPAGFAKTHKEMSNVLRKGVADEICRMDNKYTADAIVIENAGQQYTFFSVTQKMLNRAGRYPDMLPQVPGASSKEDRIRTNLMCYLQAALYYFREDMPELMSEIDTFPHSGLHLLDALNYTEYMADFPQLITYDPLGISIQLQNKKEEELYNPPQNAEAWIIL